LPPYRENILIDDNSSASLYSFHSIEDDGVRNDDQPAKDDMILFNSIVNVNINSNIDSPFMLDNQFALRTGQCLEAFSW
jgi:hypothetical protein